MIAPASVARNSILLFGFQTITKLFGFLSSVLLANYLGVQMFGTYNYAFALTALFIPLCDLGMDFYLLREIPRVSLDKVSSLASNILKIKFIITIVVFLLITITAGSLEMIGGNVFVIILLAGIVTLLRTYWTTFGMIFRGINKVQLEALYYSFTRIAEFVAILLAILLKREIIELLFALTLINIFASVYTYLKLQRQYLPQPAHDGLSAKKVLAGGLPFALTGMLVSIYFNFDTVLVSKIINDEAAGIYRAAYNLILPLTMVTAAISGAVFPYISQNYLKNPEQVTRTVRKSLSYLLMLSLPIAIITSLLNEEIINFLFKPEYSSASVSLIILVWFLPIAYVTNLFGHVLGAMDMQNYVLKVSAVNVVVNIAANIILIPIFAQNGAAVVTVLTEFIGFNLLIIKMQQQFPSLFDAPEIGKIILACSFSAAFLLIPVNLHVLVLLPIAVIIYGIGLFVTGALRVDDVKETFAIIKRNG